MEKKGDFHNNNTAGCIAMRCYKKVKWPKNSGAYPGFCSMKRLGVVLLLLDGMLVHRRCPPPPPPPVFRQVSLTVCRYPFILLGGERHCESKLSCPRTQHNGYARARTRTSRSGIQRTIRPQSPTILQKGATKMLSQRTKNRVFIDTKIGSMGHGKTINTHSLPLFSEPIRSPILFRSTQISGVSM